MAAIQAFTCSLIFLALSFAALPQKNTELPRKNVPIATGTCPSSFIQSKTVQSARLIQEEEGSEDRAEEQNRENEEVVEKRSDNDMVLDTCPSWCLHTRFNRLGWDLKCWMFQCQPCAAWVANCKEIYLLGKPQRDGWCTWLRRKKEHKMCEWVKCMGCKGW